MRASSSICLPRDFGSSSPQLPLLHSSTNILCLIWDDQKLVTISRWKGGLLSPLHRVYNPEQEEAEFLWARAHLLASDNREASRLQTTKGLQAALGFDPFFGWSPVEDFPSDYLPAPPSANFLESRRAHEKDEFSTLHLWIADPKPVKPSRTVRKVWTRGKNLRSKQAKEDTSRVVRHDCRGRRHADGVGRRATAVKTASKRTQRRPASVRRDGKSKQEPEERYCAPALDECAKGRRVRCLKHGVWRKLSSCISYANVRPRKYRCSDASPCENVSHAASSRSLRD